jgi:hypothetical protein
LGLISCLPPSSSFPVADSWPTVVCFRGCHSCLFGISIQERLRETDCTCSLRPWLLDRYIHLCNFTSSHSFLS